MRSRQLLTRRQTIGLLLAATLPAVARADDDLAMVGFVRELYTEQVRQHASDERMSEQAFYALFARELSALMRAPRPGLAREPSGRLLHAFFGWGVLPHVPVTVAAVMPAFGGTGGLKLVRVDLTVRGAPRQILVRPVREDGLWKIADISYGNGESLAAYYRRITAP